MSLTKCITVGLVAFALFAPHTIFAKATTSVSAVVPQTAANRYTNVAPDQTAAFERKYNQIDPITKVASEFSLLWVELAAVVLFMVFYANTTLKVKKL